MADYALSTLGSEPKYTILHLACGRGEGTCKLVKVVRPGSIMLAVDSHQKVIDDFKKHLQSDDGLEPAEKDRIWVEQHNIEDLDSFSLAKGSKGEYDVIFCTKNWSEAPSKQLFNHWASYLTAQGRIILDFRATIPARTWRIFEVVAHRLGLEIDPYSAVCINGSEFLRNMASARLVLEKLTFVQQTITGTTEDLDDEKSALLLYKRAVQTRLISWEVALQKKLQGPFMREWRDVAKNGVNGRDIGMKEITNVWIAVVYRDTRVGDSSPRISS